MPHQWGGGRFEIYFVHFRFDHPGGLELLIENLEISFELQIWSAQFTFPIFNFSWKTLTLWRLHCIPKGYRLVESYLNLLKVRYSFLRCSIIIIIIIINNLFSFFLHIFSLLLVRPWFSRNGIPLGLLTCSPLGLGYQQIYEQKVLNKFLFSLTVTSYFMSVLILTKEAKTTYLQYVHGCYQLLSLFPLIIQIFTW